MLILTASTAMVAQHEFGLADIEGDGVTGALLQTRAKNHYFASTANAKLYIGASPQRAHL
jgi:hypothetical protein